MSRTKGSGAVQYPKVQQWNQCMYDVDLSEALPYDKVLGIAVSVAIEAHHSVYGVLTVLNDTEDLTKAAEHTDIFLDQVHGQQEALNSSQVYAKTVPRTYQRTTNMYNQLLGPGTARTKTKQQDSMKKAPCAFKHTEHIYAKSPIDPKIMQQIQNTIYNNKQHEEQMLVFEEHLAHKYQIAIPINNIITMSLAALHALLHILQYNSKQRLIVRHIRHRGQSRILYRQCLRQLLEKKFNISLPNFVINKLG